MITLNGSLSTVKWLQEHDYPTALATKWVGAWNQTDDRTDVPGFDLSSLEQHVQRCRDLDVVPLVQSFYFGDSICAELARGEFSVKDYHGRVKSRGGFWELNKKIARLARDMDTPMYVIVDTEWNKGSGGWAARHPSTGEKLDTTSVMEDPAPWDKLWSEVAQAMQSISGGRVKVVSAPGSWLRRSQLKDFPLMGEHADIWGTQILESVPRNGDYSVSGPEQLQDALEAIHRVFPDKPLMVTDMGFSSYGGGDEDSKHPFAGGKPEGAVHEQAAALRYMDELMPALYELGVRDVVIRSYKDGDMDTANYHGYAERHWGVVLKDDTEKKSIKAFHEMGEGAIFAGEERKHAGSSLEQRVNELELDVDDLTAAVEEHKLTIVGLAEALSQYAVSSSKAIDILRRNVDGEETEE